MFETEIIKQKQVINVTAQKVQIYFYYSNTELAK